MKRLPSAPLTREDLWIWAGRYTRRSWTEVSTGDAFVAQMNVIGQDNRDAELMLIAQSQRYSEVRLTDGQVYADRFGFAIPYLAPISQPDVGPVGGDITYFA